MFKSAISVQLFRASHYWLNNQIGELQICCLLAAVKHVKPENLSVSR